MSTTHLWVDKGARLILGWRAEGSFEGGFVPLLLQGEQGGVDEAQDSDGLELASEIFKRHPANSGKGLESCVTGGIPLLSIFLTKINCFKIFKNSEKVFNAVANISVTGAYLLKKS